MFQIRQIDHVVLYAADPEASVRFFETVLGCEVVRRNEKANLIHLRAGSSMLDILPRPAGAGAGRNVDHVAFRIDPFDPDTLRAHLRSHGIEAGEVLPRFGAEGVGPSLYFDDPDGNTIELKGPPSD